MVDKKLVLKTMTLFVFIGGLFIGTIPSISVHPFWALIPLSIFFTTLCIIDMYVGE